MKTKYFLLGYGMNGENTYKLIDNLREDNIQRNLRGLLQA